MIRVTCQDKLKAKRQIHEEGFERGVCALSKVTCFNHLHPRQIRLNKSATITRLIKKITSKYRGSGLCSFLFDWLTVIGFSTVFSKITFLSEDVLCPLHLKAGYIHTKYITNISQSLVLLEHISRTLSCKLEFKTQATDAKTTSSCYVRFKAEFGCCFSTDCI